jgi:ABC-type nitrate/sulfonate/bicarbonate transport system substrate-binding protein
MRLRVLAVAFVAAAATISGCSSSGNGTSAGNGSLTNIVISQPFASVGYDPLYLAQAEGWFKQAGLNVSFVTVSGGNELAAVLGGSAQMVVTSAIHPIAALAEGQQFISFAAINQGFSEDVLITKSAWTSASLSSSSSVSQMVHALANKPLGILSPSGENLEVFQYLFAHYGLPKSVLQTKVLGTPQAALAALKAGTIAGTNLGPPFPALAVTAGYANYLLRLPLGVVPPMKDALTEDVSTTAAYYNSHPSIVRQFTAVVQKAETYIYAHPTAVANYLYPKFFQGEPKQAYLSAFAEQVTGKVISQNTTITPTEQNYIVQFMHVTGLGVPSNWKQVFSS